MRAGAVLSVFCSLVLLGDSEACAQGTNSVVSLDEDFEEKLKALVRDGCSISFGARDGVQAAALTTDSRPRTVIDLIAQVLNRTGAEDRPPWAWLPLIATCGRGNLRRELDSPRLGRILRSTWKFHWRYPLPGGVVLLGNEDSRDVAPTVRFGLRKTEPDRCDSAELVVSWNDLIPVDTARVVPGQHYAVYLASEEERDAVHVQCAAMGARTELQEILTGRQPPVLLGASWASGALVLHPASELATNTDAMAEFASASASGLLTIRYRDPGGADRTARWEAGRQLAPATLAVQTIPPSPPASDKVDTNVTIRARLPDGLVRRFMRDRYGTAGDAMVPALHDYDELFRRLDLCLAAGYHPALQDAVPTCTPLAAVAAPVPTRWPRIQVVRQGRLVAPVGLPAARLGSADTIESLSNGAPVLTTVGDNVVVRGAVRSAVGARLVMCIDNRCRAMGGRRQQIWASGLVEIRVAPGEAVDGHAQALTLHRFVSIDPREEWQPLGLGAARWAEAAREDAAVFSYVRRKHRVDTGLRVSPLVSAVGQSLPGRLVDMVPRLGWASRPASERPLLMTLAVRLPRCPASFDAAARHGMLVEPERALIDHEFWLLLVHERAGSGSLQCLAAARFRVRQQRSRPTGAHTRWVLFGDPWLSLGWEGRPGGTLALPIFSNITRLGAGLVGETSVGPAASVDLDGDGRIALRAWAGAAWGPASVPRLFSAGFAVAIDTRGDVLASPFAAINLGALHDALGGR